MNITAEGVVDNISSRHTKFRTNVADLNARERFTGVQVTYRNKEHMGSVRLACYSELRHDNSMVSSLAKP